MENKEGVPYQFSIRDCVFPFRRIELLHEYADRARLVFLEEACLKIDPAWDAEEKTRQVIRYIGKRGGIQNIATLVCVDSERQDSRVNEWLSSQMESVTREVLVEVIEDGRFGIKEMKNQIYAQDPLRNSGTVRILEEDINAARELQTRLLARQTPSDLPRV